MTKPISLLTILLLFIIRPFTAQSAVPITGKIIEASTDLPLGYANILLYTLPDSAFVSGTVSDESGTLRFDNIKSGKYLLKVSYVGFATRFMPVDVGDSPVDLGNVLLKESNVLGEVMVTTRPLPFQSGITGGIVANVSSTLLSTVGTAKDVLQRMPGVIADSNGLTVFGKGAPIVYINNRKVRDQSELDRLESSDISTVELITSPGAKYDAEGRAVLLIQTKSKINGFSAQITERVRIGRYIGDNENISIAFTQDKLNLFASYYHNQRKNKTMEDHSFILHNPDSLWKHGTLLHYWNSSHSHQASAGFDYSLNDRHAIGGEYIYYTGRYSLDTPIDGESELNGEKYESFQTMSFMKNDSYQHLMNAFYNGDFGEKFSVRFDFDYLKNHDKSDQHSEELINNKDIRTVDVLNQTDYSLYAGKLTAGYQSAIGLFEFGGEYNHIGGDGFVYSNDVTNDNVFSNKEQKIAGFISYSHKLSVINLTAGLRYEFTSAESTQGEEKAKLVDRTYSDWYPNVSLSTRLKNMDLSLAFNKRTQRPGFSQLNGNVLYINRFVFQKGNPYLNKSDIYDVNFQARHKPFLLNVGYTYTQDLVLLFMGKQEQKSNAILSTYTNFPKHQLLYATLNWNDKIAYWQPNYTLGMSQPFFSAKYEGQEINYNKFSYYFRAFNDLTLPYRWVLSCNFHYQSGQQIANYETNSFKRLDLGMRKSFFDNSLRINLMVYDVFDWSKEKSHLQIDNLRWDANKKYETRYATVSITYMFNNYKKKYRGESAAQDDINRF